MKNPLKPAGTPEYERLKAEYEALKAERDAAEAPPPAPPPPAGPAALFEDTSFPQHQALGGTRAPMGGEIGWIHAPDLQCFHSSLKLFDDINSMIGPPRHIGRG